MSGPAPRAGGLYLPGVEADPKPGVYRRLIESARSRGADYSKIWDLLAYQNDITVHLTRFTHGVLRQPASITPGFRELIAAYTSYQNACGFCVKAHAAAAAELLGDDTLVWNVLRDIDSAVLPDREKQLLRFVGKLTSDVAGVQADDIDTLHAAGWDDEAIYYAITTCALFNFYNRWITASGVPEMADAAHREQGRSLASQGYVRKEHDRNGSY